MNYGAGLQKSKSTQNSVFLLLLLVLAGTAAGSVLSAVYPACPLWQNVLFRQGMGVFTDDGSFLAVLWQVAGVSLLWLTLYALSGISLAGALFAAGFLLLRGAALGVVLGELYRALGLAGLPGAVLFVMPYALITAFAMALAARESIRFSLRLCRMTRSGIQEEGSLRLYAVRFLVLSVLLLTAGLLQCLLLKLGYPAFQEYMIGE